MCVCVRARVSLYFSPGAGYRRQQPVALDEIRLDILT